MADSKPELIYYVAQSLDGFITDRKGTVDWLEPYQSSGDDYGYPQFYQAIDSLVLGRLTYDFIRQFGSWPYPGKPCWIISSQKQAVKQNGIYVSSQSPVATLQQIRQQGHQKTWLVGGATLAKTYLENKAITKFILTIIPVLLGGGVPLLANAEIQMSLKLEERTVFKSGVVQLIYTPTTR